MMVIFLVGLVSMILMRTLRKDYARYSKDEEMDDMVSEMRSQGTESRGGVGGKVRGWGWGIMIRVR